MRRRMMRWRMRRVRMRRGRMRRRMIRGRMEQVASPEGVLHNPDDDETQRDDQIQIKGQTDIKTGGQRHAVKGTETYRRKDRDKRT